MQILGSSPSLVKSSVPVPSSILNDVGAFIVVCHKTLEYLSHVIGSLGIGFVNQMFVAEDNSGAGSRLCNKRLVFSCQ